MCRKEKHVEAILKNKTKQKKLILRQNGTLDKEAHAGFNLHVFASLP